MKADIRAFWHELGQAVDAESNATLDQGRLLDLLQDLEAMFLQREHLAVTEMRLDWMPGLEVLEIGCGNGAHAALFARCGARLTAMDLTVSRVEATRRKFDLLFPQGHEHRAIEGDAEYLPFPNERFDIVYSNGVLHHTPDTERAIQEIHRVLKPGGRAVIMLYARWSFQYLVSVTWERWRGTTEWMSSQPQTVRNPILKAYAVQDVRRRFAGFRSIHVRKSSFQWGVVPIVGRFLGSTHWYEGGRLVYGKPGRAETRLERWLGRSIGFDLNIVAVK